ncbi:MAG: hypothetical protein ACRELY_31305 [Polyangiaceae bacterium]
MVEVPERVRSLLGDRIESYEGLELLLLLRKKRDGWSSETVLAETLGLSGSTVREELELLNGRELVELRHEGSNHDYRYAPRTPELDEAVQALVTIYDEDRLAIVQIMNANAIGRVRTFAARTFADAFLIKKKKNG